MFRRPKVPNDNKKQLIFNFVSLLIPILIDFPHVVLLLRKSLGKLRLFESSEMGVQVSGLCPLSERLENELPEIVIEILKRSLIFSSYLN